MPFPPRPKAIRSVFLDHAAATPLDFSVYKAMRPWLLKNHANPSALYASAVEARNAIENARKTVAEIIFTQPDTIVFTGSGTESTNLAILGLTKTQKTQKHRKHIITTVIEHHAVLNPIKQLEKEGWKVTYLPVNEQGTINKEQVVNALRPETVLVSIMYANNEVGSIQPIADIGREILKWRKLHKTLYPYFHTDACQAAGYLDLHADRLHVDLMSLNGSKIYGPKGMGMLYKRRGINLKPIIYGGGQELGLRSGTENVAGIVGFAKALELAQQKFEIRNLKLEILRNYFWKRMQEEIPDVLLNGPPLNPLLLKEGTGGGQLKQRQKKLSPPLEGGAHSPQRGGVVERLPNNLNITFKDVDAEALILYLDEYGIQCSSGSACTTDSDEVSYVLLACGLSEDEAKSSIRLTLGKETTKKDIDYVMKYLPRIVREIRLINK